MSLLPAACCCYCFLVAAAAAGVASAACCLLAAASSQENSQTDKRLLFEEEGRSDNQKREKSYTVDGGDVTRVRLMEVTDESGADIDDSEAIQGDLWMYEAMLGLHDDEDEIGL